MTRRRMGIWRKVLILLAHVYVNYLTCRTLNRLTVRHRDRVPRGGKVLIASNHVSYFDPIFYLAATLRVWPVELMYSPTKAELFGVPFLRKLMALYGGFPVRRTGRDLTGVRQIIRLLEGEKVLIFPEGRRGRVGSLGQGNRTVGFLIQQAKPTVIPAYITGTEQLLPKNRTFPRLLSRISITYGNPLHLESFYELQDRREAAEGITRAVMEGIAEVQREALSATASARGRGTNKGAAWSSA